MCLDGTLHVWNASSNLARPDKTCETAHPKGTETTSVTWAKDGFRLATRGSDNTVKRRLGPCMWRVGAGLMVW